MTINNDPHELAVKEWSNILKQFPITVDQSEEDIRTNQKAGINLLEKACNAKFLSFY